MLLGPNEHQNSGRVLWLAVFVAAILCSSFSAAAPENVQGQVLDSEGASISGAHIIIHTDFSGRRTAKKRESDIVINSDTNGRFAVQLSQGFYDICVMADAFTPNCQKLFVEGTIVIPKIHLKADPKVIERLGDRF